MEKNKCTLLVDGNWLGMSRLYFVKKGFSKTNPSETAQQDFIDLLSRSINTAIYNFDGIIDNIVLVKDSFSWRKKILEKPESLKNVGYKKNRVFDEEYDWDLIWASLDKFLDNCKQIGMTVSSVRDAEGDDLIYYWSRKLNEEKINCIIWSSDQDLQQLVCKNDRTNTVWYEKSKGCIMHEANKPKSFEDDIDFFLSGGEVRDPFIDELRRRFQTTYLNPDDIIIKKIVCGDYGDNIQSIIRVQSGEKTFRISDKELKTTLEKLNINNLDEFFDSKQKICEELVNTKKSGDLNAVLEEFEYNKRLVWLDKSVLPEYLLKSCENQDYSIYDIKNIKNNYKILTGEQDEDKVQTILSTMDIPF